LIPDDVEGQLLGSRTELLGKVACGEQHGRGEPQTDGSMDPDEEQLRCVPKDLEDRVFPIASTT
jgi:hypothetical protein